MLAEKSCADDSAACAEASRLYAAARTEFLTARASYVDALITNYDRSAESGKQLARARQIGESLDAWGTALSELSGDDAVTNTALHAYLKALQDVETAKDKLLTTEIGGLAKNTVAERRAYVAALLVAADAAKQLTDPAAVKAQLTMRSARASELAANLTEIAATPLADVTPYADRTNGAEFQGRRSALIAARGVLDCRTDEARKAGVVFAGEEGAGKPNPAKPGDGAKTEPAVHIQQADYGDLYSYLGLFEMARKVSDDLRRDTCDVTETLRLQCEFCLAGEETPECKPSGKPGVTPSKKSKCEADVAIGLCTKNSYSLRDVLGARRARVVYTCGEDKNAPRRFAEEDDRGTLKISCLAIQTATK